MKTPTSATQNHLPTLRKTFCLVDLWTKVSMELTGWSSEVRNTNTVAGQRFLQDCGTASESSGLVLIGAFSEVGNLLGRVFQAFVVSARRRRRRSATQRSRRPRVILISRCSFLSKHSATRSRLVLRAARVQLWHPAWVGVFARLTTAHKVAPLPGRSLLDPSAWPTPRLIAVHLT